MPPRSRGHTGVASTRGRVLLRVPVANLEVSLFLACGVSIAVGVTQGARKVLADGVVVGEAVRFVRPFILELRIVMAEAPSMRAALALSLFHPVIVNVASV